MPEDEVNSVCWDGQTRKTGVIGSNKMGKIDATESRFVDLGDQKHMGGRFEVANYTI